MSTLKDGFGRVHDDLRISVTDRCNLRCSYCMPVDPEWFPRERLLTYEETTRIVTTAARLGVGRVRVTGGEPLVRRDLPDLVAMVAAIPGIDDVSLTTNGVSLASAARDLAAAGLRRVNVSLDTLDRDRFRRITGRDALDRVLDGMRRAADAGLAPVKLNTVLLRGVNDDEVEALVARSRDEGWEIRFIEFMPLENGGTWDPRRVVSGREVRERVARLWPIEPDPDRDPSAPASRWVFKDGRGRVGFIDSVTSPFCADCSRLRLTSDGKLRVCLYDDAETDLKALLRGGASDDEVAAAFGAALARKGRGGALEIRDRRAALPLVRTMHQIGG